MQTIILGISSLTLNMDVHVYVDFYLTARGS